MFTLATGAIAVQLRSFCVISCSGAEHGSRGS